MEMPELNEDILEGESNPELLNQTEDSTSLDEGASVPTEDQLGMEVDPAEPKADESEGKLEDPTDENDGEDTLDDSDLQKAEEDESQENLPEGDLTDENPDEKAITEDDDGDGEPSVKKSKLEIKPDEDPEQLDQSTDGNESQLLDEPKKEEDTSLEDSALKEEEKVNAGPDTDMLSTLASAALEQDPKEKPVATPTPVRPVKAEPETPKKKLEPWCNVGVFDTNTTIVTDYVATPEPNEDVDLVTATLTGRRIQLEPGTAYKFRVCAVNGCGTGPWSDVAAFKTTLPGFPGAPSAIKISKSADGAHLTWEPPGGNSGEILEYAVYLAVRSASQGSQPVTTNQAQLAFVRVFCGPTNKCVVGSNSLQAAHIDTTTKPAIIFRIAARNAKGYGPATQVRWLQESQNGTAQGVKRTVKA